MNGTSKQILPSTQRLAEFVAGLRCENLPAEVCGQLAVCAVDLFRVAVVGARTPWAAKAREVMGALGGNPISTIFLSADRTDPVRAAYLNGVISGSLDWDDTHVGAMLHAGVVVWPSALAIGEMVGSSGRDLLPAVAAGYEVDIRLGLSIQPGHFRRGFQSTPTCGVFGAAAAAAKLLGLNAEGIRNALAIAASYAGGTTQFFLSGSEVKRLHAGKAAAAGTEAALLARADLTGPRDAVEGAQGFARAYSDTSHPEAIEEGLGKDFRLMGLTLKPHAGSARLQAAVEAACELLREGARADEVARIEIGIPKVIEGRLTLNDPADAQQAQMSVPFAVAMAFVLGPERSWPVTLTIDDFRDSLKNNRIRELALRTRCVVDPIIEAGTSEEYVPARVSVYTKTGRMLEHSIMQPKGCPDNPMTMEEVRQRFRTVAGPLLPGADLDGWLAKVESIETVTHVRELLELRANP